MNVGFNHLQLTSLPQKAIQDHPGCHSRVSSIATQNVDAEEDQKEDWCNGVLIWARWDLNPFQMQISYDFMVFEEF